MQMSIIEFRDRFKDRYPNLRKLVSVPNGAFMPDAERINQVKMGMTEGVQDLALFHQRVDTEFRNGRPFMIMCPGMAIELKYGKNDLSVAQEEWRHLMLSENWHYVVFKDALTAMRAIASWLEIDQDPMIEAYLK